MHLSVLPTDGQRGRAGVRGLAIACMLLDDPPLRECLEALIQAPGAPDELADRLGLDEDVVLRCCRTLADHGLTEWADQRFL